MRFPRLELCLALRSLGKFMTPLLPFLLQPSDLIELTRRHYSETTEVWTNEDQIGSGLIAHEAELIGKYTSGMTGNALVIFGGSGREAFPLASRGFDVFSLDNQKCMLEAGQRAALKRKISVNFIHCSVFDLPFRDSEFKFIFASLNYGTIPTRSRRILFLKSLKRILRPDAILLLDFLFQPLTSRQKKYFRLCQWLAWLTWGNQEGQIGDRIKSQGDFYHFFLSPDEAASEAREADFSVLESGAFGQIGACVLKNSVK